MFKFLPGIILIQLVTGALVVMALNWSQDFQLVIVITMIAFFSAILTAFWFSSIARNIHHDQQTTLRKQHAQDRENFLQARHATSRNSGTPVTLIRSPTQRMGDALNALRP